VFAINRSAALRDTESSSAVRFGDEAACESFFLAVSPSPFSMPSPSKFVSSATVVMGHYHYLSTSPAQCHASKNQH